LAPLNIDTITRSITVNVAPGDQSGPLWLRINIEGQILF